MKKSEIRIGRVTFPLYSLNTLVIGSGAAGLNAALCLYEKGQRNIAIVTDRLGEGTSWKAGSDKQTYYKLSLAGNRPDSPVDLAQDLAAGGCMHGDIALAEAQGSAEAFFRLVLAGVPFPYDTYGGFVGYKTDNDPRQRATSAGPLTSRLMCDALACRVRKRGIPVIERHVVIKLLTQKQERRKRVVGAIALDTKKLDSPTFGFVLFNAPNIVLATGGPGGMYRHSVYPQGQTGAHALGFEAGATANNLTESQYGVASVGFRWNLSGAYQQVVPRYFSTDAQGGDEHEFLNDVFPDMRALATAVFLKGYEWPFDPSKIAGFGSSLVDLLVYRETAIRGRRVFLDYTRNPSGGRKFGEFDLSVLAPEAYGYLEKSNALLGTPIERLRRMNKPAVDLFKSHGIDLGRDPLEIAVCAQHNNGGFKANVWWESDVRHLFPVGEVCGTHGVSRPGGSALNAGQVGSRRAAEFIARRYTAGPSKPGPFAAIAASQVLKAYDFATSLVEPSAKTARLLQEATAEIQARMSACGAHVRRSDEVARELPRAWDLLKRLRRDMRIPRRKLLPRAFEVLGQALTHVLYLEAVAEYLGRQGQSRGSFIVPMASGEQACPGFEENWRYTLSGPDDFVSRKILEIGLDGGGRIRKAWVDTRPVPSASSWFETVWNDFINDRIIQEDK